MHGTMNRVEPRPSPSTRRASRPSSRKPSIPPIERYRIGQNLNACVLEVRPATGGPQVVVQPHPREASDKPLMDLDIS